MAAEAVSAVYFPDCYKHGDENRNRPKPRQQSDENANATDELAKCRHIRPGGRRQHGQLVILKVLDDEVHTRTVESAEELLRAVIDKCPAQNQTQTKQRDACGEIPVALTARKARFISRFNWHTLSPKDSN